MTASKRYMPEEDTIILKSTQEFDPANKPEVTLSMLLEDAAKDLPGRNRKGIRDRYYRLTGMRRIDERPAYAKRLNPGPRSAYRHPVPETKPVPKIKPESEIRQSEPEIRHSEQLMVAIKPMRHPAVQEPSSWIKPPSKAQLMSRTGRLIR